MATITVTGRISTVRIIEGEDESGEEDYGWQCERGHLSKQEGSAFYSPWDAVMDAELHADIRCEGTER